MKTFCKINIVKCGHRQTTKHEEHGLLNHLITGKAVTKKKEQAEREGHIHACHIEASSAIALLRRSFAQQLRQVQERERLKA